MTFAVWRAGGDRRAAARSLAAIALATLAVGGARATVDPRCAAMPETSAPEPEWHARLCFDEEAAAQRPVPEPRDDIDIPISNGYAHDIRVGAGNFVRHRLNDFPGQTVLGEQDLPLTAQDFDPLGETLYALDRDDDVLGTLDLADGSFTAIGPAVPVGAEKWSGLAVHPLTRVLFGAATDDLTASSLYTIDPTTGTATFIGSTTVAEIVVAIAADCDGNLYAHDILTDSIYTLDPATGADTLVGPTGVDARFAQGMDFDNSDGTLYAWIYLGGGANQYGTIDTATGAFTPLSEDDPFGQFEGATQTLCFANALLFEDGFETGDTGAWTTTVQ